MEEEQDPSAEFIKAFNHGYIMEEHAPELLEQLLSGNEENDKIKAMKAGKLQYERERFKKEMEQAVEKSKGKERER